MLRHRTLHMGFNLYKKHVLLDRVLHNNIIQYSNYCCIKITRCKYEQLLFGNHYTFRSAVPSLLSQRNCSQTIDEVIKGLQIKQQEKEYQSIRDLFPQPRVMLKEFQDITSQKVFEVYYKQSTLSAKGVRKKGQNEWVCTYVLLWPERIKFESTALSKRQAAEKAALQALHYLYKHKKINQRGNPIHNKEIIGNLKSSMHEPLKVEISEQSVKRIRHIWEDYLDGIKNIYEATFEAAKHKVLSSPSVFRDSTIDEEDDAPEIDNSLVKDAEDLADQRISIHPVYGRPIQEPSKSTLERRDRVLNQKFERYDKNLLPLSIDQYASEIISTVKNNQVTIIVGAAGCGKSTRVPAAILKSVGAKTAAIVTEPRRVAAMGLAERVADEMSEEIGDSIGYQVRLHSKTPRPPAGSILYCTSGVLLRRLQTNPGLTGCTHVFIDEAHERDVNTDLTLLLLKRALVVNPDLKVVVMSATLDIEVFTNYFDSCPVVEVPGRTFPVQVLHLDEIQSKFNLRLRNTLGNCQKQDGKPIVNCQEVVEVIKSVDKTQAEGAILVFLPGWAEIKQTKLLLNESLGDNMHLILPVHSRLSTTDQTKMFSRPLPGVRKVVLATNIAETSITIPDVVYVVDTGAHKENRIREGTGTASLETVWVSQAGAKQRTGRAGRVQPGHCYRLYTKEKEEEFAAHTTPEILRIPLEQTVLDCKSYAPQESISDFLSELPEPPSKKAIQFAVNDLIDLGALTSTGELTRLGSLVSQLPLHPRLSIMVVRAAFVGNVVAMANTVTQCSDNVELFRNANDRKNEIREIKRKFHPTSDHASLHHIQDEYETIYKEDRSGVDEWCDKYGLRRDRLNYVKSISNLYLEQLLKLNLLEPTIDPVELNRFSDVDEFTAAVLLSGADCILRCKKTVKTKGKLATAVSLVTSTGERSHIGSESVNHAITKRSTNSLLAYFGGFHSIERRALVVYKTSLITPHTALLFCKGEIVSQYMDEDTTLLSLPKHRLEVHVPKSHADHIIKAKEMLWNTFQYYIDRDLKSLDFDENTRIFRFKTRLVKAIGRLLIEAHRDCVDVNENNRNEKLRESE